MENNEIEIVNMKRVILFLIVLLNTPTLLLADNVHDNIISDGEKMVSNPNHTYTIYIYYPNTAVSNNIIKVQFGNNDYTLKRGLYAVCQMNEADLKHTNVSIFVYSLSGKLEKKFNYDLIKVINLRKMKKNNIYNLYYDLSPESMYFPTLDGDPFNTMLRQNNLAMIGDKHEGIKTPTQSPENEIASQNSKNEKISLIDSNIPIAKTNTDNTYVLIIANETYSFLDKVNYATNDGKIFKEYCIKTLGIPEKQIFLYENASYGLIADGVSKLTYCLDNFEDSKAIVYYCGHGIPDEKTGQAYLIPVDGKGTNMTTCYSLKDLYKTLAATKAQSITYFMDACFTGANKEGSMLVAARGVAREPMKETLAGRTIVFSASSGDETAMTLEEQGHGLFTYYLLKKLQETEGNVTYGELADYIKKNVQKDAFLINEKPQTPVVATSPAVQNTWKTMKLK